MSSTEASNSYYRWMVPYWAELHLQSSFFVNLAPKLQAQQLAEALEADHPAKAQEIREWNPATRRAMLAVLDEQLRAGHRARHQPLWSMRRPRVRPARVAVPGGTVRAAAKAWGVCKTTAAKWIGRPHADSRVIEGIHRRTHFVMVMTFCRRYPI